MRERIEHRFDRQHPARVPLRFPRNRIQVRMGRIRVAVRTDQDDRAADGGIDGARGGREGTHIYIVWSAAVEGPRQVAFDEVFDAIAG
jgi:hypothetical protein